MQITEVLLIVAIALLVVLNLLDKSKENVRTEKTSLVRVYYETIALLWFPVVFLVIHLYFTATPLESIGISWNYHWQIMTGLGLLSLLIVYFIYDLKLLVNDQDKQQKLAEQMASFAWFMPKTKPQMLIFTLGLSVSAGICEELIFRGYILNALSQHLGVILSVILSSALFGLCHFYQGVFHVFRTFIIGIVFCLIYLGCETIIIPIILHIVLDVYGGISSYIVRDFVKETS
ncbi:CPBP family intramembrane glutamic endopeptidase [Thalassotalea sp. SU-HH00458]|uniref:CPBP family intramembrane glutamic endopeptidase n=1 Tax=Thalassotalea sp. SU-HH00458 TaxID=3127657 RepID=UPI00310371BC